MTVKYEENESGVYWVDGDRQGEPQKDLRHAMDDYQADQVRKAQPSGNEEQRVHTGDDGGPGESTGQQLVADNEGSAGESQATDGEGSAGEARSSRAGRSGKNAADSGSGSAGAAGSNAPSS